MTEIKYYSLEEVAQNNGKNGDTIWIIIRDGVYDVTSFVNEHPGGSDLLLEWAGKDGTKEFDDAGHTGDAKKILKSFKIGEVQEEERKKKQSPKVVDAPADKENKRSCINMITCGLCG